MHDTLTAYFLCAGYGHRLKPLTDRVPKPAIPFLGQTALEINFRLVQQLFPIRVLCNTHHLYEEMEKPARKLRMDILYEKDILGTGGCLWNAKHILQESDHFLVHNGDLIHTINLKDLMQRHLDSGDIATLAGMFRPTGNTLSIQETGRLLGIHGFEDYSPAGAEEARATFSGIAIYRRAFLNFLKPGAEDIKPYWTAALRAGKSIGVINYSQNSSWYDFGTPQGLWEAAKFYMEKNKEFSYQYAPPIREACPYVSNESGMAGLPEALRDVLVMEEPISSITPHTSFEIIGRDFRWKIRS